MAEETVAVRDATPLAFGRVEEIAAALSHGFDGPRAFLVALDIDDGKTLRFQPVMNQHSVLDIETELKKHLNEYPHSTDWLEDLRDYIDQRLEARALAKAKGGLSLPAPGGGFVVVEGGINRG